MKFKELAVENYMKMQRVFEEKIVLVFHANPKEK